MEKEKTKLAKFWNWLWHSESLLSYLVFLILVFIFIKLIFFPVLSLLMGTSLPLAIVESSSMDHRSLNVYGTGYDLCGNIFPSKQSFNLDKYWNTCGKWYESNFNITKEQFSNFKFKNGFSKGDLIIIIGKQNPKIGEVIIFKSTLANPIIHRLISQEPLQTKGDHNPAQLPQETNISKTQIIGVAVARIPYIGWIKLFFVELWNYVASPK